jgi:hypothetical protein
MLHGTITITTTTIVHFLLPKRITRFLVVWEAVSAEY